MFNHQYQMIANQKQQEIEQHANNAWKYNVLKKKITFQRIMQLIKPVLKPTKSIKNHGTCAVC